MNLHNFSKFDTKKMIIKEMYKNLTKFFISNKNGLLKSDKIMKVAYKNFYFYKASSKSYFRRACIRSGNCRSVFRFFKMSRYLCKFYASNGFLVGISKASF